MYVVCVQAWSVWAGAVSRQWSIHTFHSPDTQDLKIYNSEFTTSSYKKWKKKDFFKKWICEESIDKPLELVLVKQKLHAARGPSPTTLFSQLLSFSFSSVSLSMSRLSCAFSWCSALFLSASLTPVLDWLTWAWRSNGWMKKCSSLAGCCKLFSQTTHPSRFWVSYAMVNVS